MLTSGSPHILHKGSLILEILYWEVWPTCIRYKCLKHFTRLLFHCNFLCNSFQALFHEALLPFTEEKALATPLKNSSLLGIHVPFHNNVIGKVLII